MDLPPETDFDTLCRALTERIRLSKRVDATCDFDVRPWSATTRTRGEAGVLHTAPTRSGAASGPTHLWTSEEPPRALETEDRTARTCNLVRKWNVRFDRQRDPVSFLERLEERIEAYNVRPEEVVRVLPEVLKGTALLWYRNYKDTWDRYESFRRSFELQFFPPGYQRNLDEEIRRRTQGENESFREFVVAIETLMRRRGNMSLPKRIGIIYSNMRPDYKFTMKREDLILRHAEHIEGYVREKAIFRPPPSPSMLLVPETAYQPNVKAPRVYKQVEAGKATPLTRGPTGAEAAENRGGNGAPGTEGQGPT